LKPTTTTAKKNLTATQKALDPYVDFELFIYTAIGQTFVCSGDALDCLLVYPFIIFTEEPNVAVYFLIAILAYAAIVSALRYFEINNGVEYEFDLGSISSKFILAFNE
jgi:hypothetical protein